jgi:hypothetical protein
MLISHQKEAPMNQKLCKALRTIVFANNPSSVERAGRKWAIYEDKKKRMLICLDPRQIYKTMKRAYVAAPPIEKIFFRKEINKDAKRIKKDFPRGSGTLYKGQPSLLGNILSMQPAGERVREHTPLEVVARSG